MTRQNEFGQPIGPSLAGWIAPSPPPKKPLLGRYCQVVPLNPAEHGPDLHAANQLASDDSDWTYLSYGPFASLEVYLTWLNQACLTNDPLFYAIIEATSGKAVGVASYLRIEPDHGVIEIGHLKFSPRLQKTTAASEALMLMIQHVFELGYRRCEWKCDALNAPSRAAAARLGFTFEGIFRQVKIYRARSRDTA